MVQRFEFHFGEQEASSHPTNRRSSGYHGTSVDAARAILAEGFKTGGSPICFVPNDNLSGAMAHGARRAKEHGDSQYAVVIATFPEREVVAGLRHNQLEIPPNEVGSIAVHAVLYFDAQTGQAVPQAEIAAQAERLRGTP